MSGQYSEEDRNDGSLYLPDVKYHLSEAHARYFNKLMTYPIMSTLNILALTVRNSPKDDDSAHNVQKNITRVYTMCSQHNYIRVLRFQSESTCS